MLELFPDKETRKVFYELYNIPEDADDTTFTEVYSRSKGDYINQVKNFHRSQQGKQNWRKHRFNYERGIKRYHRK